MAVSGGAPAELRLRLLVVPTAQRHIRAAKQWWTKNRPAAPKLLNDELEKAFDLIASQPHIGPPAPNVKTPGVRRFHLARIHYHLYYRPKPTVVEVLALWHVRRGSDPDL
jgi:plasmid stabilization system protein ParE